MDVIGILNSFEISRDKSTGHIYAVEYDDGIVKIGRTESPKKRMYSLTQYRGPHSIKKVYISGIIPHSRVAERLAMRGLKPCERAECFDISFNEAVERVKAVAGCKVYFEARDFEGVSSMFPNAVRAETMFYIHAERLFALMNRQVT